MKFTFEDRTCECGNKWRALDFWDEDMPCHDCARRAYEQRIAEYNSSRDYVIESIGGACPTQAEGVWPDGQRFYFRARHGSWTLRLDPEDAVIGEVVAGGDDGTHGWMDDAAVLALLDKAAAR